MDTNFNDFHIEEPPMCPSEVSCILINGYLDSSNADVEYGLFLNNLIVSEEALKKNRNIINKLNNKVIFLERENSLIEENIKRVLIKLSKIDLSNK